MRSLAKATGPGRLFSRWPEINPGGGGGRSGNHPLTLEPPALEWGSEDHALQCRCERSLVGA